MQILEQQS